MTEAKHHKHDGTKHAEALVEGLTLSMSLGDGEVADRQPAQCDFSAQHPGHPQALVPSQSVHKSQTKDRKETTQTWPRQGFVM